MPKIHQYRYIGPKIARAGAPLLHQRSIVYSVEGAHKGGAVDSDHVAAVWPTPEAMKRGAMCATVHPFDLEPLGPIEGNTP